MNLINCVNDLNNIEYWHNFRNYYELEEFKIFIKCLEFIINTYYKQN
jgi:hypothetical protein